MPNKKVQKSSEEWKRELTPEQYRVTREKGTETPFTGKYWNSKEKGMYRCVSCGAKLFSSDVKFDSGTGWPSFTDPVAKDAIRLVSDDSFGMHRTEVVCAACGAHLGHVFDDGPKTLHGKESTGKRYCLNSCALDLEAKPDNE